MHDAVGAPGSVLRNEPRNISTIGARGSVCAPLTWSPHQYRRAFPLPLARLDRDAASTLASRSTSHLTARRIILWGSHDAGDMRNAVNLNCKLGSIGTACWGYVGHRHRAAKVVRVGDRAILGAEAHTLRAPTAGATVVVWT